MNRTKKRVSKVIVCFFGAAMLLFSACTAEECGSGKGKSIEVDGWRLWQYSSNRQVNIIALIDETKIVDGVLTIPTKVGKYTITSFGGTNRGFIIGTKVKMIVVPADITANAIR